MNYWFIIANTKDDEHWSWTTSKKIGEQEEWTYEDKVKKNFGKVQIGDLAFGYNAGEEKAIVAIARITKKLDRVGKCIGITKIKDLNNPITYDDIRNNVVLKQRFKDSAILNTTILPLAENEFDELLRMI